jgi:hypothetical protein
VPAVDVHDASLNARIRNDFRYFPGKFEEALTARVKADRLLELLHAGT